MNVTYTMKLSHNRDSRAVSTEPDEECATAGETLFFKDFCCSSDGKKIQVAMSFKDGCDECFCIQEENHAAKVCQVKDCNDNNLHVYPNYY